MNKLLLECNKFQPKSKGVHPVVIPVESIEFLEPMTRFMEVGLESDIFHYTTVHFKSGKSVDVEPTYDEITQHMRNYGFELSNVGM